MTGLSAGRAQELYEQTLVVDRAKAVLACHRDCPVDADSRGMLSLSDSMAVGLPAALGDPGDEESVDADDLDPFGKPFDPGDPGDPGDPADPEGGGGSDSDSDPPAGSGGSGPGPAGGRSPAS